MYLLISTAHILTYRLVNGQYREYRDVPSFSITSPNNSYTCNQFFLNVCFSERYITVGHVEKIAIEYKVTKRRL